MHSIILYKTIDVIRKNKQIEYINNINIYTIFDNYIHNTLHQLYKNIIFLTNI